MSGTRKTENQSIQNAADSTHTQSQVESWERHQGLRTKTEEGPGWPVTPSGQMETKHLEWATMTTTMTV